MISAILFDLDGTLLDSDMDVFIPQYFRALTTKLAPVIAPAKLMEALTASTRILLRRKAGGKTNQELFWADFLPRTGCREADIVPLLDAFYTNGFPALRRFTALKPQARPLVTTAFAERFTVAIATQPVFPLAAIRHRLTWAGVDDFSYALVTCYENMHSTKPDPAFYAEICERIGHTADACIMIGNELDADIRPAAAAGLHTFWLTDEGQEGPPDLTIDYLGTLTDARDLLVSGALRAQACV